MVVVEKKLVMKKIRNCPVTQGMVSERSFLTKQSSEELRWLQKDLATRRERFV